MSILNRVRSADHPPTEPAEPALDAPAAVSALLPVSGADLLAPLVDGTQRAYANLDYAASAPALSSVVEHVTELLPYYASVHRGAGFASQVSTDVFESARQSVARFVGARADDVVIFTRNTTDALNLLATAVPHAGPHPGPHAGPHAGPETGGDVVFLDVEHHANLLPWRSVPHRCIPAASTVAGTLARLADTLRERPAALVAVTGSSNVTGEILPIARIAEIAHAHGARIVVDAAQLAPHRRIDGSALDVDYVAFSGHKLYAPFGVGVLVGRADWLDAAPPYLAGGGAVREVGLEQTTWAPSPARHEGGTPNVLGAAALARACTELAALPPGALEAHESQLRTRLLAGLSTVPGVRILKIWPDAGDQIGVVAFTIEGHHAGRVAAYLSAEHGIGVRDGRFCAHPLLARLLQDTDHDPHAGAIRASVGVGSRSQDVDRLVSAVRDLVTHGERWSYALREGRWAPTPDPRPTAHSLALVPHDPGPQSGSPCESPT